MSVINIDFSPLPFYQPLFQERKPGIVICMGGRGTGKSINVGGRLPLKHVLCDGERGVILRDEQVKIKQSIFNDIRSTYHILDDKLGGVLSQCFEMQEKSLKCKFSNEDLIFQAGFKSSSNEKSANQKGFSNVRFAVLEEAEDFRDEEKFLNFRDSVTRFGCTIYILLNTPDINHWIIKRYFDLEAIEHEGYYKPIPKRQAIENEGVRFFINDYTSNPLLDAQTVRDYSAYGDPNSLYYNLDHYLNQILGYVTTGRKGLVYPKYNLISEFPDTIEEVRYGLDFGFSEPAALVKIGINGNNFYIQELLYKSGMTNQELAIKLRELGISEDELIVADLAEPKSIEEIYQEGFNIHPCVKGSDSVSYGIQKMNQYNINVVDSSTNLINELQSYTWQVDKNGVGINKPVDKNDHALSAARYALTFEYHTISIY